MDDGELEDVEQARRSEVMANALRHASFGRLKSNEGAGHHDHDEDGAGTSSGDAPTDPGRLG